MLRRTPLALAGMLLLTALPAQGSGPACTFAFEVPAEALAGTWFVLGVTPEGACIAELGAQAQLAPIGPVNPARADACATAAPAILDCAGSLGSRPGSGALMYISGAASGLGSAGEASTTLNHNTGAKTTWRCFWNGVTGGLAGALVFGGGCGYASIGSGASFTVSGASSLGNAGALVHGTA